MYSLTIEIPYAVFAIVKYVHLISPFKYLTLINTSKFYLHLFFPFMLLSNVDKTKYNYNYCLIMYSYDSCNKVGRYST